MSVSSAGGATCAAGGATDNTTFKGHEITPQQNDTLDLLEQIKKHVQADKAAMAKLESAGLSPENYSDRKSVV